jgi:protein-S-isoprenylcysteine O-methyltransferase Ste14
MTTSLVNVILIGVVSLIAFETIIYWHTNTKGTWKNWPAGRSLMYLLLIIAFGFGFGVFNQFLGDYSLRPHIGFVLYVLFIGALIVIRITIRAEMKRGKQRLKATLPTTDDTIDVTVATENEESNEHRTSD